MNPTILDNNIIFRPPNLGQAQTVLPCLRHGRLNDGSIVASVPLTLENSVLLRNLGVPAPSPIRTAYDWPGRFKPRWYQIDTAEFLTLNKRAFCLNSMRTGKTLASLWAADYLKKQGLIRKVLIISPLSTIEVVWADEIFKSFHLNTFAVLHGSSAKRKELLAKDHDYYIINHHGVEVVKEALAARDDIDLIIVDEVAVMRNSRTKMFKTMKSIIKPEHWLWGLTGTPTPNEPTDAYGIMKLIKPENYAGHFTRFKQDTMYQCGPFKWVPRANAEHLVARVLQPSIRFTREVCTDMEPCYIERQCELSPEQALHYKKLLREAVTEIKGETVTAVNAAALLSKLVQCCLGSIYAANGENVEMDFGPRLRVLEELIEENDGKVLVFVPYTNALDALARELRKKWTCEVVDGGVAAGKRSDIFRRFQTSKDPHVIVAHPATMAHGLDLTAATLIAWYAPHTKNEEYLQANARIDGSKQTVKQDIAHIFATPVERKIYASLREKGQLQQVVLDLIKGG